MNNTEIAQNIVDKAIQEAKIQTDSCPQEFENQVVENCRKEIFDYWNNDIQIKARVKILLRGKIKRKIDNDLNIYDQDF